jgi:cold shock CspA family protein
MNSFLDFLRQIPGIDRLLQTSFSQPQSPTQPQPPMDIPDKYWTQSSKALEQVAFALESYDLKGWKSPRHKRKCKHDLAVMLMHDDLDEVKLELIGSGDAVLTGFSIRFEEEPGQEDHFDPAEGIELPLVDREKVARHRLIVSRSGREGEYEQFLKLSWSSAEKLQKRSGSTYESEHARKITGGRQSGAFHVGDGERHRLTVTQSGTKGYAFARDHDLGQEGIFLHREYVEEGAPVGNGRAFEEGERLTAIVVQTPKGLQGRSIRPAG